MKKTIPSASNPAELLEHLRSLVADTEKIAGQLSDEDEESSAGLMALPARVGEFCVDAKDRIVAGAKSADETIRSNPYRSIAIALGAGLLIGAALGRRK